MGLKCKLAYCCCRNQQQLENLKKNLKILEYFLKEKMLQLELTKKDNF